MKSRTVAIKVAAMTFFSLCEKKNSLQRRFRFLCRSAVNIPFSALAVLLASNGQFGAIYYHLLPGKISAASIFIQLTFYCYRRSFGHQSTHVRERIN